jgi:hypothetical protein
MEIVLDETREVAEAVIQRDGMRLAFAKKGAVCA